LFAIRKYSVVKDLTWASPARRKGAIHVEKGEGAERDDPPEMAKESHGGGGNEADSGGGEIRDQPCFEWVSRCKILLVGS